MIIFGRVLLFLIKLLLLVEHTFSLKLTWSRALSGYHFASDYFELWIHGRWWIRTTIQTGNEKETMRPGIRTSPVFTSLVFWVNNENDGGDGNDKNESNESYGPYIRRDLERSSNLPSCLLLTMPTSFLKYSKNCPKNLEIFSSLISSWFYPEFPPHI